VVSLLGNFRAAPCASATCEFIARLDPARSIWTVGGAIGGRWVWASFYGSTRSQDAEAWIAARYRDRAEVWLLLSDTRDAVGPTVSPADICGGRFAAAWSVTPEAFLTAPWPPLTVYLDRAGKSFGVWKLPATSADPRRDAGSLAVMCCVGRLSAMPQLDFIPLPGDMKPVGRAMGSIIRMPNHGRAAQLPAGTSIATINARPVGTIIDVGYSPVGALPDYSGQGFTVEEQFLAQRLEECISKFGVAGRITNVKSGPVVTVCDFEKAHATKLQTVIDTADDVAMLMKSSSIIARSDTARGVICFDVANAKRETVFLRDMFKSEAWREARETFALPISIGVTVDGTPRFADLARMPHLLVAGSTGSGKSVALNAMLLSLLTRYGPDKLRLMLIDPKRVELTSYAGIPHILAPVATDAAKAVAALEWLVTEMERRYGALETAGVKTIARYNAKGGPGLPFIVVVIDEYASLMHLAPKPVNAAIGRLTAEARAAGIYLVLATQHPSAKTLTPPIRANVPVRLIFKCAQKETSQAAVGSSAATKLLGAGDGFLWLDGTLERIHGALADDEEVEDFVDARRALGSPVYALTFDKVKPLDAPDDEDDDEDDGSIPVKAWLRGRLKGQPPTLSTTVITEGVAAGYNHRAVRRAAKSIGVTDTPSGQVGVAGSWELP
jgi:hypothetical protein